MSLWPKSKLDAMRCANGCDDHPLVLHSRCHPYDPLWPEYERSTGLLILRCSVRNCQREVATIQVAEEARPS
jgi:hypothetical protein